MLSFGTVLASLLIGSIAQGIYGAVLLLIGLFLICLILLQRGRGGGLAGAFGGMGGQSAFGSKAGDAFTHFTIVVAAVWIVVCILGIFIGDDTQILSTKAPPPGFGAADGESAGDAESKDTGAAAENGADVGKDAATQATSDAAAATEPEGAPSDSSNGGKSATMSAEGEITTNPEEESAAPGVDPASSTATPPNENVPPQ